MDHSSPLTVYTYILFKDISLIQGFQNIPYMIPCFVLEYSVISLFYNIPCTPPQSTIPPHRVTPSVREYTYIGFRECMNYSASHAFYLKGIVEHTTSHETPGLRYSLLFFSMTVCSVHLFDTLIQLTYCETQHVQKLNMFLSLQQIKSTNTDDGL